MTTKNIIIYYYGFMHTRFRLHPAVSGGALAASVTVVVYFPVRSRLTVSRKTERTVVQKILPAKRHIHNNIMFRWKYSYTIIHMIAYTRHALSYRKKKHYILSRSRGPPGWQTNVSTERTRKIHCRTLFKIFLLLVLLQEGATATTGFPGVRHTK